jgi:hypothetical protein
MVCDLEKHMKKYDDKRNKMCGGAKFKSGDKIRKTFNGRTGLITYVMRENPAKYSVQWDGITYPYRSGDIEDPEVTDGNTTADYHEVGSDLFIVLANADLTFEEINMIKRNEWLKESGRHKKTFWTAQQINIANKWKAEEKKQSVNKFKINDVIKRTQDTFKEGTNDDSSVGKIGVIEIIEQPKEWQGKSLPLLYLISFIGQVGQTGVLEEDLVLIDRP